MAANSFSTGLEELYCIGNELASDSAGMAMNQRIGIDDDGIGSDCYGENSDFGPICPPSRSTSDSNRNLFNRL